MTTTFTSLLETPDLPMKKILEKCDFMSILALRKTCVSLRNFIDDAKPNLKAYWILIKLDVNSISFLIQFQFGGHINLKYFKKDPGCLIGSYGDDGKHKTKFLENSNFLEIFSRDFGIFMNFQGDIVERLRLELPPDQELWDQFWAPLQKILVPEDLKVRKLHIDTINGVQLSSILPFFLAGNLKKLNINGFDNSVLDTEQLVELEQWKQLDALVIKGVVVRRLGVFKNLKKLDVKFVAMNMEEVGILIEKQNSLKSSTSHVMDFNIFPSNHPDNVYNHYFQFHIGFF